MREGYPSTFIDNIANVIYYQNAKLLTAIAERYNFDKAEFLNEYLISAQEFKNDIINEDNSTSKSNKKEDENKKNGKKYKIIEYEDTEYYWNTDTGNVYFKSNPSKLAGKINKEGELMLHYS